MSYDYGAKYISKYTGLTGVESRNVAKKLNKIGVDFATIDWKTVGEDTRDFGKRSKSVKSKLKNMYGISLDSDVMDEKYLNMNKDMILAELHDINNNRSMKAIEMDFMKRAKRTFKPTNVKGVALWKKHPNRYDIIGVDDKIF